MFYIWGQVSIYWEKGITPITLLTQLHPHFLRYLLVYPFFVLSEWTGISSDIFYSIFIYLNCAVSLYIIYFTLLKYNISQKLFIPSLCFFVLMFSLGLIYANGRGIISSSGILILFFTLMEWNRLTVIKKIPLVFFSFLFCSVSTGVIFCCICAVLVIGVKHIRPLIQNHFQTILSFKKNINFKMVFLCVTIFSLILFFAVQSVYKNYSYYGSIVSMLDHGVLGLITDHSLRYLLVPILISIAGLIYFYISKYTFNGAVIIAIFIISSLFGRLTFLSIVPLMITLFLIHISRVWRQKN